jgi:hypothetical protein
MDAQGTQVISPEFEDAGEFRDGQSPVQLNQLWGLVDMQGKLQFPCRWRFPTRFANGYAVIREKSGSKPERRGYLKQDGTWIVEPKYLLATAFSCGRALVFNGSLYGFINEDGAEVIPLIFKDARDFREDLAPVKLDDKWGYIDGAGNSVIRPQFDAAMPFSEGMARVSMTGSWGFINRAGEFVIPPQFAIVWDMHFGLAVASLENKSPFGFIDSSGRFAIRPAYKHVAHFQEGLAAVIPVNKRLQSFIGLNGEEAFGGEFWSADSFHMQRALVMTEKTIAYLDPDGKFVWESPVVDRLRLPF